MRPEGACSGECCEGFFLATDKKKRTHGATPDDLRQVVRSNHGTKGQPGAEQIARMVLALGYRRIKGKLTYLWTCKHFDKETRLCKIYEMRPRMCRNHPPKGKQCDYGECDRGKNGQN